VWGAALGALLRWVLGTQLNSLFPSIPPGTVVANLVGGYLIGVALLRGTVQDITERKRQEAELGYLATHDLLTGLPNRVLLLDRLQRAISYAQGHERQVAVVFIDLDRFKFINDSMGHTLGDKVLKAVADRLRENIRESDTIALWGGDEFVLVLDIRTPRTLCSSRTVRPSPSSTASACCSTMRSTPSVRTIRCSTL
jgi:diguanylate cyclase (GGDEF)-like protein